MGAEVKINTERRSRSRKSEHASDVRTALLAAKEDIGPGIGWGEAAWQAGCGNNS
jgi:hypothetical protein